MGKVVEKHQLEKTILQRREQGLLGSMETKDSHELESKKKSTLVQNRRRQNDQRRDMSGGVRWNVKRSVCCASFIVVYALDERGARYIQHIFRMFIFSRVRCEAGPASSSLSAAWLLSRAVLESACCVFFFGVDFLEIGSLHLTFVKGQTKARRRDMTSKSGDVLEGRRRDSLSIISV